jgi:hypothetical protein
LPELITPKEAAARERVHVETIYRRLRRGIYKTRHAVKGWWIYVDAEGFPLLRK